MGWTWQLIVAGLLSVSLVLVFATLRESITRDQDPAPIDTQPQRTTAACSQWVGAQLPARLDEMRRSLLARCQELGAVNWTAFHADPREHAGKTVLLRDSDFKRGTLRVTQPACLRLAEDAVVDFAADNDYYVDAGDSEYQSTAFRAGFFAGITIETEGFLLDLGGHTLRQSRAMNLQQRPYAHVSLSDRPFRMGDGPGEFGGPGGLVSAARGAVYNGHLGLSSHHGVHGLGPATVLLEDLRISDYEVAGIALNDAQDLVVRRVALEGTSQRVPVRGLYNQGRILVPLMDRALAMEPGRHHPLRADLRAARDALYGLMREAFEDIVVRGREAVDQERHPLAHALFHNAGALMDGNAYGLLLHGPGTSVNNFEDAPTPTPARVLLDQVTIEETVANIREVVALEDTQSGEMVRGPVGDVFRVESAQRGHLGLYTPDALAEAQMALAAWVSHLVDLDAASRRRHFPTLHFGAALQAWRRDETSLARLVADGRFRYRRNGDAMFHVNKGVFGLRVDGGHDICVRNSRVSGVSNLGAPGHMTPLAGEATDAPPLYEGVGDTGGHPLQAPQRGYMGADARGISVAATHNITFDGVVVERVQSASGWAHGIDLFNAAQTCFFNETAVESVAAMPDAVVPDARMALKMARAVGVCAEHDALPAEQRGGLTIRDVTAGLLGCALNFVIYNSYQ